MPQLAAPTDMHSRSSISRVSLVLSHALISAQRTRISRKYAISFCINEARGNPHGSSHHTLEVD